MSVSNIIKLGLLIVVLLLVAKDTYGSCVIPEAPLNTTVVADSYKESYETGEPVVWACTEVGGRFGYIVNYCQESGDWSEDSRACTDSIKVDTGSIFGMCMAAANIIIAAFSIIWSRKFFQKADEVEDAVAA